MRSGENLQVWQAKYCEQGSIEAVLQLLSPNVDQVPKLHHAKTHTNHVPNKSEGIYSFILTIRAKSVSQAAWLRFQEVQVFRQLQEALVYQEVPAGRVISSSQCYKSTDWFFTIQLWNTHKQEYLRYSGEILTLSPGSPMEPGGPEDPGGPVGPWKCEQTFIQHVPCRIPHVLYIGGIERTYWQTKVTLL